VGFLTSHKRWAFPFLSAINLMASQEFVPQCLSSALILDVLTSFAVALAPWSHEAEFTWFERSPEAPTIFVDAQVDHGLVGVVILELNSVCTSATFDIPSRYRDSQQSAEMYGVLLAINIGLDRFGGLFNLASDSISSIMGVLRPCMATGSLARNSIIRSIFRKLLFKKFLINLLWVPSKHNPSDLPSRSPDAVRKIFSPIPFSSVVISLPFLFSSDSFLARDVSGDSAPRDD
jgi:hypothetical protein